MLMSGSQRLFAAGAVMGGTLAPGMVLADTDASALDQLVVTGVRSMTSDKIPEGVLNAPQSIDLISRDTLAAQGASRLADALRNVPGITFNAGEGSARGDTVNLRGFPAFNDFFLDGVRDAAVYTRDSFNLESVEVLEGPSAVLFGRGSTGGAINQVSKAPTLAPVWSGTVVGGTNDEIRGTVDIDQKLGDSAAIRINAMGERSQVAERDDVYNHRWGIAPSVAIGIGGPDTFTASYLHQEENNRPDTGIPFVGAYPAQVPRSNFYGLSSDRATANVDIGTLRYRHAFSSGVDVSDTLRYASYNDLNQFNAPHFGYLGSPGAPTATTPLSIVKVGRDAPSSSGVRTNLTNQTDLTARFDTGPISHTLVAGAEFGREYDATIRYNNPLATAAETPATPLLDPNPNEVAAPQPGKTRNLTTAHSEGVYFIDTVHIGSRIDITGGVRFDRFAAHYRPTALVAGVSAASLVPLDHTDKVASPRASLVYRPVQNQLVYVSYGTSFDPSAEALSLSTKTANLDPVKAKSYEAGIKSHWLGGMLTSTAAIFQTQIDNAQTTDPDHPTALILGGNQRVRGVELGLDGHITDKWEITAGYTYLDGKTVFSTTAAIVGKQLPNVARNAASLWTEYYVAKDWEVGVGGNYVGQRFADSAQSAILPGYVLVNAMVAYTVNDHVTVRANVTNLFNKLAFQSAYYSSPLENHEIPAAGRTGLLTVAFDY